MSTLTLENYAVIDSLFDNLLDFFFCGIFVRPEEGLGWSAAQVAYIFAIEFVDGVATLRVRNDGAERTVHLWIKRYTGRLENV